MGAMDTAILIGVFGVFIFTLRKPITKFIKGLNDLIETLIGEEEEPVNKYNPTYDLSKGTNWAEGQQ